MQLVVPLPELPELTELTELTELPDQPAPIGGILCPAILLDTEICGISRTPAEQPAAAKDTGR